MDKAYWLAEIKEIRMTDAGVKLRGLLEACIQDLRIRNDTALGEDILKNQGAIQEFKTILRSLSMAPKYEGQTVRSARKFF